MVERSRNDYALCFYAKSNNVNALKSLFSSIHNDKAIKSLEELGVSVYEFEEDGTKHFRNLQDVFIDLMLTSHTTSKNMERDLLAISGGRLKLAA
jgi:hypothetical protein